MELRKGDIVRVNVANRTPELIGTLKKITAIQDDRVYLEGCAYHWNIASTGGLTLVSRAEKVDIKFKIPNGI